jgi:hypothetical protein
MEEHVTAWSAVSLRYQASSVLAMFSVCTYSCTALCLSRFNSTDWGLKIFQDKTLVTKILHYDGCWPRLCQIKALVLSMVHEHTPLDSKKILRQLLFSGTYSRVPLHQGFSTRGPRATCGPRSPLPWPAGRFEKITTNPSPARCLHII